MLFMLDNCVWSMVFVLLNYLSCLFCLSESEMRRAAGGNIFLLPSLEGYRARRPREIVQEC